MEYELEHVQRYLATDGEDGHEWERSTTVLLLTTTGRRSGEPRTTPLIYRHIDGAYAVVASNDGSERPPSWYLNLSADPAVEVQVLGERFRGRARTAGPQERPALWAAMTEVWPDYRSYQERAARELAIVLIDRVDAPSLTC
jgi:deazaflavin-dependent oxidoreductase (nitroreductase family)